MNMIQKQNKTWTWHNISGERHPNEWWEKKF